MNIIKSGKHTYTFTIEPITHIIYLTCSRDSEPNNINTTIKLTNSSYYADFLNAHSEYTQHLFDTDHWFRSPVNNRDYFEMLKATMERLSDAYEIIHM